MLNAHHIYDYPDAQRVQLHLTARFVTWLLRVLAPSVHTHAPWDDTQ